MEREINLRKCSYDPSGDLYDVQYDKDRPASKALPVAVKLYCFELYCIENNIKYEIDESQWEFVPWVGVNGGIAATVTIRMDDCIFRSTSTIALKADDGSGSEESQKAKIFNAGAIQTAATYAKGRCLTNIGFGPCLNGNIDDGIESFSDDDLPFTVKNIQKLPTGTPVTSPERVSDEDLNKARNFVCMVPGTNKGKKLYDVLVTDPKSIEYYASDRFTGSCRNPGLKEACRILLENKNK